MTTFVMALLFLVWAMPVQAQDEEVPVEEMPTEGAPPVEVIIVEVPAASVPPPTIISIDSPTDGAQVFAGQRLAISGWATDPSGTNTGVSVVYVYLDAPADEGGVRLDEADYGRARPDVAQAWGRLDWTNSGFELSWPVSNVIAGRHTLYVYAHSVEYNESVYQTVSFNVLSGAAPAAPPASPPPAAAPAANQNALVRIISPGSNTTLSGTTSFTVVAVDCLSGTAARSVRINSGSESGSQLATASAPTGSRDLSTVCPGRSGAANIEFQLSVNTSSLSNGVRTFTAVADIGGTTVSQSVSAEVANGTGGIGAQTYNQNSTYCQQYPNSAGCSGYGTGSGTYLYNRQCSASTGNNCNPNYPNNYGCVSGSVYPCSSTGYGTGSGNYLYNQQCTSSTGYNCNPNYPNNYGCVSGSVYPCSNTGSTNCNPYYPTPVSGYSNVPCSGNTTNCNPYYPTAVSGYTNVPCSGSGYGSGSYLYNVQCTSTSGYNCNPNYPNNYGCVSGSVYPCSSSSLNTYCQQYPYASGCSGYGSGTGMYLYNQQCTAATGYNCNPTYPNNYGCVSGSIYPCRL